MATKKNQTKDTKPKADKKIKAWFVKSRSASGFRRCGMKFVAEGTLIHEDLIDEQALATLQNDPDLIVTEAEINADALLEGEG